MRHHIYLACVKITFMDKDGDTGVTEANAMIRAAKQQIGVEHLARAQQGAIIQLGEKLQEPELKILDAVFTGVFYLGHQTEEEFNKRTPVSAQTTGRTDDPAFTVGSTSTGLQDN